MKLDFRNCLPLVFIALSANLVAMASPPSSQQLIEQLELNIANRLAEISQVSLAEGKAPGEWQFELKSADNIPLKIGMVLDTVNVKKNNGYVILSVTPLSLADLAKIKVNDVITKINDNATPDDQLHSGLTELMNSPANAITVLELRSPQNNSVRQVKLVSRAPQFVLNVGEPLEVNQVAEVAAENETSSACGTLSLYRFPNNIKGIYEVTVSNIDGNNVLRKKKHFQLSVGKHQIYLHEQIVDPAFTRLRQKSKNQARLFEINIEANQQYYLAAKFTGEQNNAQDFSDFMWEPIIWKSEARDCD